LAHFEANLPNLGAAGSSAGGWSSGLVKLGALGVIGGALVAAGLSLTDSAEPAAQPEAQLTTTLSTPSEPQAPEPKPAQDPQPAVTIEDLEPLQEAAPATPKGASPAAPAKPSPAAEPNPAPARDALLAEEVKQLRQIRRELAGNPAKALAMANEGHQRFRKGVLYQEREALALSALHGLGRRQELEQRGNRYLKAFPSGSFSGRVRQLLGQ
jgi:hypothetical protein